MVVLFDIETRSPTNLREKGGRNYAADARTEIISAAWYDVDTGRQGLWLPGVSEKALTDPANTLYGFLRTHVNPDETAVYVEETVPAELVELARSGRPFVAHNAWGFDQHVWEAHTPPEAHPVAWIDTDPLARAVGLPGGLDRIGLELRGEGKHQAGKARLKKFFKFDNVPTDADRILIGAYNLDDTAGLLKVLWEYLADKPLHEFERKVLASHRVVNADGVAFDWGLATALKNLAAHAANQAFEHCRALSGGPDSPFKDEGDLRKRDKVFDWIARAGGRIGTSLNKKVIEQLIRDAEAAAPKDSDDEALPDISRDVAEGQDPDSVTDEGEAGGDADIVVPPVVVEFLKARFAVLRITKGKIDAAINGQFQGRLHDLLIYFGAHTGRFAGRRMQIQNLPRPKETVPVWDWTVKNKDGEKRAGEGVIGLYERTGDLRPAAVQEILDAYYDALVWSGKNPDHLERATLDDAAAAALRGVLVPDGFGTDAPDRLATGDYNAIELRGGAWVADEEKLVEMFAARKDVYCMMAEQIYGRPCTSKKDPIRQVGKVVVLAGIYQQGSIGMATYAAASGIDLAAAGTSARQCVIAFRDLFPAIAGTRTGEFSKDSHEPLRKGGIWKKLEAAAIEAMYQGSSRAGRRIRFEKVGKNLHMVLPSGRPIVYRDAQLSRVVPWWEKGKPEPRSKEAVTYRSPRGFRNVLYGGKLLENAVQGLCRDILVYAQVQAQAAGHKVRFTVHDELVASVRNDVLGRDVMQIMSTAPDWADGFPVLVEADMMPRYAKTNPRGWDSFNYENGKLLQ